MFKEHNSHYGNAEQHEIYESIYGGSRYRMWHKECYRNKFNTLFVRYYKEVRYSFVRDRPTVFRYFYENQIL